MSQRKIALIQRNEQFQILSQLMADAARGHGWIAWVIGSVATGKTAFLDRFAEEAANSGAIVLHAIASPEEQSLPFGVADQLLESAKLTTHHAANIVRLVEDVARDGNLSRDQPAQVLRGIRKVLLDLSQRTPLLLVIDDAHHADLPSLRVLAHLGRRIRGARILALLAEDGGHTATDALFRSTLLQGARWHTVELKPLSSAGVAELLAQEHVAELLDAKSAYRLTGGNPLLLHALLEDLASEAPSDGVPRLGPAFTAAVQCLLYRCEPLTVEAARTLAVFGRPADPLQVSRMLKCDLTMATRVVGTLNDAGILADGRFRHDRTVEAIMETMTAEERAARHAQVAKLLHGEAEPAVAVATHLLQAPPVAEAWAQNNLREAGEQMLALGDVDAARSFLRHAREGAVDPRERAETTSMLARVEWRIDPSNALWHLSEIVDAVRAGQLSIRQALMPVSYMLWHGRPDEAMEVLATLCAAETMDATTAGGLAVSLLWLAYLYPDHADRAEQHYDLLNRRCPGEPAEPLPRRGAAVLATMLARTPNGDASAATKRALGRVRLENEALGAITVALTALYLTDRFCSATVCWCDPGRDMPSLPASTCHALSAAAKAEFALIAGDGVGAEEHIRTGLQGMSQKGWGVAIGSLLSAAVLTATESGDLDNALRHLSVPVPAAVFKTPFGLRYLYARGRYFRSVGRNQSAVADLEACGEIMVRWDRDEADLVPWRTELALAYHALGRTADGVELAREQLRRLHPGQDDLREATLGVLATVGGFAVEEHPPAERPATAKRRVSTPSQASSPSSRIVYDTVRVAPEAAKRPVRESEAGVSESLSGAELRVAELAARGYSNREIAGCLHITVSTVEQHLTRVYRKLHVAKRKQLARALTPVVAHAGGPPAAGAA